MRIECRLALPAGYDQGAFRAFHARDTEAVAERVAPLRVSKGIVWRERPALIEFTFTARQVRVGLALDRSPQAIGAGELKQLARHVLGLNQPVQAFAAACSAQPQIGPLITQRPGLCIPQTTTPFEAICWAIIGQQISVLAATAIRRRLILECDLRHSSGLWCFPSPAVLGQVAPSSLLAAGLSRGKLRALLALREAIEAGAVPAEHSDEPPALEALRESLLSLPGIGPWTANYALLRGFSWSDASLHGDVAVRRSLAKLLGRASVTPAETEQWLESFTPWRSLVAAHLWAMPA